MSKSQTLKHPSAAEGVLHNQRWGFWSPPNANGYLWWSYDRTVSIGWSGIFLLNDHRWIVYRHRDGWQKLVVNDCVTLDEALRIGAWVVELERLKKKAS